MELYLVQASAADADGIESFDLIVSANSAEDAVALWRTWEIKDGFPDVQHTRVWRLPPIASAPQIHGWETMESWEGPDDE